ncbi:MAG: UTP--glucose-1-phosphate uridylyltransferase, partial [Pseudomonadota bacterium]
IMKHLHSLKQGAGGEIQLTDAIAQEVEEGENVYGLRFRGQRFDCGSKAGFLQATVSFGLGRPDLRDEFGGYLDELHALRSAAQ